MLEHVRSQMAASAEEAKYNWEVEVKAVLGLEASSLVNVAKISDYRQAWLIAAAKLAGMDLAIKTLKSLDKD